MIGKSSQTNLLSNLLQQAELRHKVVSQNIANVNTPGYRNLDVRFDETLHNTAGNIAGNTAGHTDASASAMVEQTRGLVVREDGNNVDLDRELGKMTKNSMEFETFSHLLMAKFSLYRSAITGQ